MAPQKEITYNSTSYSVKTSPSKIGHCRYLFIFYHFFKSAHGKGVLKLSIWISIV